MLVKKHLHLEHKWFPQPVSSPPPYYPAGDLIVSITASFNDGNYYVLPILIDAQTDTSRYIRLSVK